jgi:hypothetical protein
MDDHTRVRIALGLVQKGCKTCRFSGNGCEHPTWLPRNKEPVSTHLCLGDGCEMSLNHDLPWTLWEPKDG